MKQVLIMGGAVDHPGNVSPLAEANFAHDSRAAKVVVDASRMMLETDWSSRRST